MEASLSPHLSPHRLTLLLQYSCVPAGSASVDTACKHIAGRMNLWTRGREHCSPLSRDQDALGGAVDPVVMVDGGSSSSSSAVETGESVRLMKHSEGSTCPAPVHSLITIQRLGLSHEKTLLSLFLLNPQNQNLNSRKTKKSCDVAQRC